MMNKIHAYWEFPHAKNEEKDVVERSIRHIQALENTRVGGSLVYFHHTSLDPWMIATKMIQHTKHHVPLIALQPYTMEPATAAMMIHSIYRLYGRKVDVNMITGGLPDDLEQMGNTLTKEERFARLIEYTTILRSLLTSNEPLTFQGQYYRYKELVLHAAIPEAYMPQVFVPLIVPSKASIQAIDHAADIAITLPKTFSHFQEHFIQPLASSSCQYAVKMKIIARPTEQEAFAIAEAHQLEELKLKRIARSILGQSTSLLEEEKAILYPSWGASLVMGSYDQVLSYLRKYVAAGVRHFVLPYLFTIEDTAHLEVIFSRLETELTNHSSPV